MAKYAISGVWKNSNDTITHYAIHPLNDEENTIELAQKISKPDAIRLLENSQNSAITIMWNYGTEKWTRGSVVEVVGNTPNKYLRSRHDGTERNNLAHLIDYGMVATNFS